MIFTHIRFYVTESGQYVSVWVYVPTSSYLEATNQILTLCSGYYLGSGFKAWITHMTSERPNQRTEDMYNIHSDSRIKELRTRLAGYMGKDNGNRIQFTSKEHSE